VATLRPRVTRRPPAEGLVATPAAGDHAHLLQGLVGKPSLQPIHLDGINRSPSMIGKWVCFYIRPVLLKSQPSGLYQALDLAF